MHNERPCRILALSQGVGLRVTYIEIQGSQTTHHPPDSCAHTHPVRVKVFECGVAQTQLHASPPHAPPPARQAAMERATPLPKGRTVLRPRGRAPAGEGVEGEYLSAVRRPCMPPPPPLTVLSAWEGCAPGAQLARAAAPEKVCQVYQVGIVLSYREVVRVDRPLLWRIMIVGMQ